MSKADQYVRIITTLENADGDEHEYATRELETFERENRALIARALRRDAMIEDPTPEIVEIVERAMDNPWLAGGEDILIAFGEAVK